MTKEHSLPFKVVWEDFRTYRLSDGSLLKAKMPLTRLVDTGERDDKGNMKILFEGELLVRVDEAKKQTPSSDQTITSADIGQEVSFTPISDPPQIYYDSENKQVLLLSINITKVRATTKVDPCGYPMYNVDTTTSIKTVKSI